MPSYGAGKHLPETGLCGMPSYGAGKYLPETGLCTCTKNFGAATLVRKSGIAYDYLNKEKQETE